VCVPVCAVDVAHQCSAPGAAHSAPGPPVSKQARARESGAGVAATLARIDRLDSIARKLLAAALGGRPGPNRFLPFAREPKDHATGHGRLESVNKEVGKPTDLVGIFLNHPPRSGSPGIPSEPADAAFQRLREVSLAIGPTAVRCLARPTTQPGSETPIAI
jgi:hypothetical protein